MGDYVGNYRICDLYSNSVKKGTGWRPLEGHLNPVPIVEYYNCELFDHLSLLLICLSSSATSPRTKAIARDACSFSASTVLLGALETSSYKLFR